MTKAPSKVPNAPILHPSRCDRCKHDYPVASCVITCRKDGTIPIANSAEYNEAHKLFQEIITGKKVPFKNHLHHEDREEDVGNMYYICHGQQFHGNANFIMKNTEPCKSVISSQWITKRIRYHGRTEFREWKLVEALLIKTVEDNPDFKQRLDEVYLKMCEQPAIARAADFHITLGNDVFILYSCNECETCPVMPNKWIRISSEKGYNTLGSTEINGYWRCPNCVSKWEWKTRGATRLLLIPDIGNG